MNHSKFIPSTKCQKQILAMIVNKFQIAALITCFIFGVCLILNTQVPSDGVWYWYAKAIINGRQLYSDLHLNLQPVYVLETALWMSIAGGGWFVSKVPALLHLFLLLNGAFLVCRGGIWSDWQKAILIMAFFFFGIHFEAYRFDDYHVLLDAFYLYALYILLTIHSGKTARQERVLLSLLGALGGLALLTRLNDGAALIVAATIVALIVTRINKLEALGVIISSVGFLFVLIITLTGDGFYAYVANSIFAAAGAKGGLSHLVLTPFMLLVNATKFLLDWGQIKWLLVMFCLAGLFSTVLIYSKSRVYGRLAGVGSLVLFVLLTHYFLHDKDVVPSFSAFAILMMCVVVLGLLLINFVKKGFSIFYTKNTKSYLILLPLALLASGALSTGGYHFGLYIPVAMVFLLLPHQSFLPRMQEWLVLFCVAVFLAIVLNAGYWREMNPFSWLKYTTYPLFTNRIVYEHPLHGRMYIDKPLNSFFSKICSEVGNSKEFLSLPFPYANYYCGIEPWRGYVQTFFDTTDKRAIETMITMLRSAPPQWILYQRQLDVLALHENIFNHGNRLPHREIDELLMNRIESNQWKIVLKNDGLYGSTWFLIKTK